MRRIILLIALLGSVLADRTAKSMADPKEESPAQMTSVTEVDQETSSATLSLDHESSVAGREIPKQHHHSVHWRPDPKPEYVPYEPFHYTPTPAPPKVYRPPPTAPPTTPKPRYSSYYGQDLYSDGCGCIPYRYA